MGTTEHRGDAAAFTSPVHLWGGLRQDDGGWCAEVDLTDGRYIEDTVLYEDGAVGALLRRVDPFANKLITISTTPETRFPSGSPPRESRYPIV